MSPFKSVLLVAPIFLSYSLFAQGAPPATPIDGGLIALLAAGIGFGIKKIFHSKITSK